ncbi:VOC family protein [Rickettsiales endosymbiont of Paramecium tredecaurelia]|uniref:VOC family protein n=1 Tax=Candidatus Sarmatiella mevalonica TaxID=2770581 RepID=UPI001921B208|nr:VOC family protein [Candidatus Sarmatiella mevalonica]MBL3284896.1 VOC family protein [Candidatus Sarmatiella mevalonica]
MQPRISMITLGTRDLARATQFYEKGLNFPRMDFPGDVSFFTLSGCWLSLYPWELLAQDAQMNGGASGFRGITLAHNVANENEVITVLAQAEEAGGRVVKRAQKADWGGFSGYFIDLDEHLWEVAYNPYFHVGAKDVL